MNGQVLKALCIPRGIQFQHVEGSSEFRFQCPQCEVEKLKFKDFKLYFNIMLQTGHCWRCGMTVSLTSLLSLFNLRKPVVTAPTLKHIRDLFSVADDDEIDKEEIRDDISRIPESCVPALESKVASHYLHGRGLSEKEIKQFEIHYCKEGYFGKRIIIPVFNEEGEYQTFVARKIVSLEKKEKPYLYPKGCRVGSLLYNLHTLKYHKELMLVEGVFDAIACFPHAVATFGKHITDAQVHLLRTTACERVGLCWDADAWRDTPKLWDRAVSKLSRYFNVVEMKLPEGDPDEYEMSRLLRWLRNGSE